MDVQGVNFFEKIMSSVTGFFSQWIPSLGGIKDGAFKSLSSSMDWIGSKVKGFMPDLEGIFESINSVKEMFSMKNILGKVGITGDNSIGKFFGLKPSTATTETTEVAATTEAAATTPTNQDPYSDPNLNEFEKEALRTVSQAILSAKQNGKIELAGKLQTIAGKLQTEFIDASTNYTKEDISAWVASSDANIADNASPEDIMNDFNAAGDKNPHEAFGDIAKVYTDGHQKKIDFVKLP